VSVPRIGKGKVERLFASKMTVLRRVYDSKEGNPDFGRRKGIRFRCKLSMSSGDNGHERKTTFPCARKYGGYRCWHKERREENRPYPIAN